MLAAALSGCSGRRTGAWARMDKAEAIIESYPDSAFALLKTIDTVSLGDAEERARYALLMSMALDKNYIDTTTFTILQPAIDYYLDHGTPNERLRTYYYQGCIHQNRGDNDKAMHSFINGAELINKCTDSLVIARLLVAQGNIYFSLYKIEPFVEANKRAASFYSGYESRIKNEFNCLLKVLDGYMLLHERAKSDSILNKCKNLSIKIENGGKTLEPYIISYILEFENNDRIKQALDTLKLEGIISDNTYLNLANCYNQIGQSDKALQCLQNIDSISPMVNSLKYYIILTDTYSGLNLSDKALSAYRQYAYASDSIHNIVITKDLLFAEDKHSLEMIAEQEKYSKRLLIYIMSITACVLIIVIGWIYYSYRITKIKKLLAQKEALSMMLERDKAISDKSKLEIEKQNAELERDKKQLITENLIHRVNELETESHNLKELLNNQRELSAPIKSIIKERLKMLNTILARGIIDKGIFKDSYEVWVKRIISDKEAFMNSNRLAFKATHPQFINYLEQHNLTLAEINYVCLYALGLRGKDVGAYINIKRHYVISSTIRQKLGLTEHDTNLSIYINQLLNTP